MYLGEQYVSPSFTKYKNKSIIPLYIHSVPTLTMYDTIRPTPAVQNFEYTWYTVVEINSAVFTHIGT